MQINSLPFYLYSTLSNGQCHKVSSQKYIHLGYGQVKSRAETRVQGFSFTVQNTSTRACKGIVFRNLGSLYKMRE